MAHGNAYVAEGARLERRWRRIALTVMAILAIGVAVLLVLIPLGDDGDSLCGTLLIRDSTSRTCNQVATDRTQAVVVFAVAAFVLAVLAFLKPLRR